MAKINEMVTEQHLLCINGGSSSIRFALYSMDQSLTKKLHGMQHTQPEIVTPELLDELHRYCFFDSDHLPREIELIETFIDSPPLLFAGDLSLWISRAFLFFFSGRTCPNRRSCRYSRESDPRSSRIWGKHGGGSQRKKYRDDDGVFSELGNDDGDSLGRS